MLRFAVFRSLGSTFPTSDGSVECMPISVLTAIMATLDGYLEVYLFNNVQCSSEHLA